MQHGLQVTNEVLQIGNAMDAAIVPEIIDEGVEQYVESLTDREYRLSCAPKYIPIATLIKYSKMNLTLSEIGTLVGISKQAVSARFKKEGYTPERLNDYKVHRADVLSHKQSQLLNSLTPSKVHKMGGRDTVIAMGILFDKERLERDQSTSNVNMLQVNASLDEVRKQRERLQKELDGVE